MKQFLLHLLGTTDVPYFLALVFFAMIGAIISLLIHASNRVPSSQGSPYKFRWGYLICDNWQRILLNILLILVTIRFCKELTGFDIKMPVALLIGVSYDKLAELLRNKGVIDKPKTP